MALNLLNSFGRRGVAYGLLTTPTDVIDTDYLSKYFVVSEFSPTFTAGRNAISFNGSALLQPGSEILIECLDSAGHNLFVEMALSTNTAARTYPYKESTAFVFSIHVYNDTADGVGKLILYGTLIDGRSVKWVRNITIDKTAKNQSRVRFYNRPTLEVEAVQVPILSTAVSSIKSSISVVGQGHGLAVDPPKDTNLPTINRRNINIDYRLVVDSGNIDRFTNDTASVNSQMLGATVYITPLIIQKPLSLEEISISSETEPTSYVISEIVDNRTVKLSDPYFYTDGRSNQIITNIVSASFSLTYPYISYNTGSSYLQSNINGTLVTLRSSYADVTYRNIRPFSGFLARHKVYRKSLLSNADFSVVADEPLFVNEMLRDNLTHNKYYELMGKFYNQGHIDRYWFTSSNKLNMIHTPDMYIDSMYLSSPVYNSLSGSDYIMVKNDSVTINRDAAYIPFNQSEYSATSGSSYDSNFMGLKSSVQYLLQISAVVEKDSAETEAKLEVYFTSSVAAVTQDPNYASKHGILLATLAADTMGTRKIFDDIVGFYTPPADLYGTLVLVPYKCQAYIRNLSFRVYGDDGFSPDVFTTRIPWPISVANETYQIKAELFDVNHDLVYSDLNVVQNFDPAGTTLIPYIPGSIVTPGTLDVFVSGSLYVSKSAYILEENLFVMNGNIYVPSIDARPQDSRISSSRLMAVRGDAGFVGELTYTPIVDIDHDNSYIQLTMGSLALTPTSIEIKRSIASEYTTSYGGHIYYVGGTKTEERPTGY